MAAAPKIVVVLGLTGSGKSSLLNIMCGIEYVYDANSETIRPNRQELFKTGANLMGITTRVQKETYPWRGQNPPRATVTIVDTPGASDPEGRDQQFFEDVVKFLRSLSAGVHAFLIIFNGVEPRYNQNMQKLLQLVERMLSPDFWSRAVLVFTNCDPGAEGIWKPRVNNWLGEEFQRRLRKDFTIPQQVPTVSTSIFKPTSCDAILPFLNKVPFMCDSIRSVDEFFLKNPNATNLEAFEILKKNNEAFQKMIIEMQAELKQLREEVIRLSQRPVIVHQGGGGGGRSGGCLIL